MKIPTVRLVFDRKKVATKKNKGLIQLEVLYEGKRKWITTGIKVYSDQWDSRRWVINSADMYDVNSNLRDQVQSLEKWLRDTFTIKEQFSWEKLEQHLHASSRSDNFIEYAQETMEARNDIKPSTKKVHHKLISILKEYGKITYFSDLTASAILDFDNWLHGRKVRKLDKDGNETYKLMRQQSLQTYHKLMKVYIGIARKQGLVKGDPYFGLSFQRGESEAGRYLNDFEFTKLKEASMRSGSVARARDLFVFQVYTGLSYSDLKEFDFNNAIHEGSDYVYTGKRKKSGEKFCFIILPEAMRILQKYNNILPVHTIESYNQLLKKAAKDAGIDKPLSSHWARRTAGMMFLNAGVRLEVVARILGHSSVRTTEKYYTDVQDKTVAEEMKNARL